MKYIGRDFIRKMFYGVLFLGFCVFILDVSYGWGGESSVIEEQSALQVAVDGWIMPFVKAGLGLLIGWVCMTMRTKYGIDVSSARLKFIHDAGVEAFQWGMEKSAAMAKEQTQMIQFTGKEQLAMMANKMLRDVASVGVTRQEAEETIEAILARTPGEGATKDNVYILDGGTIVHSIEETEVEE